MSDPNVPTSYRRRSLAGPVVLIALGVLFLLGNMHTISWNTLGHWFAQYWPVLIIVWGVIKLVEHYMDRSAGVPPRGIGAGGVVLLVFLIIIGLSLSAADKVNWSALHPDIDGEDVFPGLFGTSYTYTQDQEQAFPAGGSLHVGSDRGDVSINAWDEDKIKISVNKKVIADKEETAKSVDEATHPLISVDGPVVTVNANTGAGGNHTVVSDLEIFVPRKAAVDVSTRHGDITIHAREGEVKATTARGDIHAEDVVGNISTTLRRGSVNAARVKGDVNVDGRAEDVALSDIDGNVRLSGEFFGDIVLSRISKSVAFKSSRTDMEVAGPVGDMNMESGDLRMKSLTGPTRIVTRNKDVHLDDVSGDVKIEDTNASVELHVDRLPLGHMDVSNQKGDVQIELPSKANFEAEAHTRRGEVNTDFSALKVTNTGEEGKAAGTVGSGGPRLQVANTDGNIDIRSGTSLSVPGVPAIPTPPSLPAVPKAPAAGKSPAAPKAPSAPSAPKAPKASGSSAQVSEN